MEPENLNCKECEMRMHCITASKTICEEEYEQMMEEQAQLDRQRELKEDYIRRQEDEDKYRRREGYW